MNRNSPTALAHWKIVPPKSSVGISFDVLMNVLKLKVIRKNVNNHSDDDIGTDRVRFWDLYYIIFDFIILILHICILYV